jgi:hypothetical protein
MQARGFFFFLLGRNFSSCRQYDDVFMREVIMTTEEFTEAVGELIAVAREGGLSDTEMIVLLEDADRTAGRGIVGRLGPQPDHLGEERDGPRLGL